MATITAREFNRDVSAAKRQADHGPVVITDRGQPAFVLMSIAEYVTKTLAICARCGAPAGRTQRLSGGDERVLVGATDSYEPRCRGCHSPRAEQMTESLSF